MKPFSLKIVTPDGLKFDGEVEELVVRSTTGDIGIMAGHVDCVAPLGMGQAMVVIDGVKKYAACIGGIVSVVEGAVSLVPTTFEWAEDIDVPRAERSYERAQAVLNNKTSKDTDILLAKARLRRALIRKDVGTSK